MAEPVVLSGSSLNTFLRCQRQWELAYVYTLKRPPSLKQARGIAGHYAAEIDLTQKIETRQDLPLDVVLDAFRDSFVSESQESEERPEKKETKAVFLDSGVRTVTKWHEEVAPTIQPTLVEYPIQFTVNGIPYSGTGDFVDDKKQVRDWKFVSRSPSNSQDYALNMVGYAIGYRQRTGDLENGVILDHMVATKEPKHVQIASDGPVPDESIVAFARTVEKTHESIQKGSFPPTGLKSGACSWCGYQKECGYYVPPPGKRATIE